MSSCDDHRHPEQLPASHELKEYVHGDRNPAADIFVQERPWGDFQQFVSNEQVTVKIITVQPGHRLSLQKHQYRGEMWTILDAPIEVEIDERQFTAQVGDTVWVPCGAVHRMGNSGERAGRILEVGFGFFDEADIERLQDDYSRPCDD